MVLTDSRSLSEERRTALADHLAWTMTFLGRHHTSEDEGLYPMVLRENPAARELLEDMDADHRLVHPAMEQVADAARAFRASGTIATTDVLAAIDALEAVLYPHLAREEDETMPVVAASITATDWHRLPATPEQVWQVLTDVPRIGEWSHECHTAQWLDGADQAAVGARFRGTSKARFAQNLPPPWSERCSPGQGRFSSDRW